ncbi:MAG: alpha/beta hydrolase [Candidatus Micrarchaeota archaeon]|nr:alpha/beta hydrolase [Candidatus Micrarchaeota archaeon]MDE1834613.1 alpha/beta hydrolase [Candidatus Micrarchaeota archaeon]MDE1859568.1 alpha/beta hydrolase [Candidatus Micrarchaeota archaeon]
MKGTLKAGTKTVKLKLVTSSNDIVYHHPVSDAGVPLRFLKHTLRHTPNLGHEWHAAKELLELVRSPIYRGEGVQRGNGEPVMLIPGIMCTDHTLYIMRGWLNKIGYRAYTSEILNVLPASNVLPRLENRLKEITDETGRPATLIGQSFGGALAKLLSDRMPHEVSKVIGLVPVFNSAIGVTPLLLTGLLPMGVTSVAKLGPEIVKKEIDVFHQLDEPASVRLISIYTKKDGILTYRTCLRKDAKHYEVDGTHLGMGLNKYAYQLTSQFLHQRRVPKSSGPGLKVAA